MGSVAATSTQHTDVTSRRSGWWQILGIPLAYNAYELARAHVGNEAAGYHHATQVVRAEKALHLDFEPAVQRFFSQHITTVQVLNVYYGIAHFIWPVAVLVVLWRRAPLAYNFWRNCLIATTLLALIVFWLWPLMPPRLLPHSFGFVDTDATYGGMGALNAGVKDGNLYAAMPSLHIGWAVWCAAAASSLLHRRSLKLAMWVYPAITMLTVIATGNHYFIDGPAGIAADAAGALVGGAVTGWLNKARIRRALSSELQVLADRGRAKAQPVDVGG